MPPVKEVSIDGYRTDQVDSPNPTWNHQGKDLNKQTSIGKESGKLVEGNADSQLTKELIQATLSADNLVSAGGQMTKTVAPESQLTK